MVIHQFRPVASGAELQAERLAAKLVALGHRVEVLTQHRDPRSLPFERAGNIAVHRVDFPLSYWPHRDIGRQFRFLLKNRRSYDVVHSHQCFNHAVIGTVVARCFGKKSVIKIACAGDIGDLCVFSGFRWSGRARQMLLQADALIAVSSAVEAELQAYGFSAERIHRIPNGVDTDLFTPGEASLERSPVRFVLIGRRTPQKGVDIALQALAALAARGYGKRRVCLELYGLDYPEHDYRGMAAQLGVQPMVRFLPPTDSVLDVYHQAHCLILPSRAEGLSNVLLEAMACRLPVIATSISGNVDVVEHDRDGILLPPEDAEALARAMELLILHPDHARRLAESARHKVTACFSLDRVARQYSHLYQELAVHGI